MKVAFLDLDGVLADTFEIHVAGWCQILRRQGAVPNLTYLRTLRSVPTYDAMTLVHSGHGLSMAPDAIAASVREKNRVRDTHVARLKPDFVKPGVPAWLKDAKDRNYRLIVLATTSAAPSILDRTGLAALIDSVICGTELMPPKRQSPARIMQFLADYSLKNIDALLIDDSAEITSLTAAGGVPSVCIGNKTNKRLSYLVVDRLVDCSVSDLHRSAMAAL